MLYKCDDCGRTEESKAGPPKCSCGLPQHIIVMKPVKENQGGDNVNEYLTEG